VDFFIVVLSRAEAVSISLCSERLDTLKLDLNIWSELKLVGYGHLDLESKLQVGYLFLG